jgi:hypothetical protein
LGRKILDAPIVRKVQAAPAAVIEVGALEPLVRTTIEPPIKVERLTSARSPIDGRGRLDGPNGTGINPWQSGGNGGEMQKLPPIQGKI